MITVFVVMLASSLMLVIGLVVDGGAACAARSDALDEATSAARSAAQMIDEGALRRDREITLDPVAARRSAADFIASTGDKAAITITQRPTTGAPRARSAAPEPRVTVTVTRTVSTQFLWAIGISSFTESATATVSPEPGSHP